MIKFINISKKYKTRNNDFYALKDINLTINEGVSLGVIGASGAGKSTLLRLINGLIKPSEGEVLINDVNINLLNQKALNEFRKNFGMVFQHFNLFSSLTVFDNVKLALKIYKYKEKDIDSLVIEALKFVNLENKKDQYPSSLSGGEKQRVSIARAIINKPRYLLLDEITSALDQKTAFEILDVIANIKNKTNITIIFISHQLEMIRKICDEVVILNNGIIIEEKSLVDLYLNPKTAVVKDLIPLLKEANKYRGNNRYLLTYSNDALNKTILSDTINKYNVNISIILAETIVIKANTIGYLLVDINGNNKEEALRYLQNENIIITKLEGGKNDDTL